MIGSKIKAPPIVKVPKFPEKQVKFDEKRIGLLRAISHSMVKAGLRQ